MSDLDHTEDLARRVLKTGGTEKERAQLARAALGLVSRLRGVGRDREMAMHIQDATCRIEQIRVSLQSSFDDLKAAFKDSDHGD